MLSPAHCRYPLPTTTHSGESGEGLRCVMGRDAARLVGRWGPEIDGVGLDGVVWVGVACCGWMRWVKGGDGEWEVGERGRGGCGVDELQTSGIKWA